MTISNFINSIKTETTFSNSYTNVLQLLSIPDIIPHIFFSLSMLDLQKGLTTNSAWYAISVNVVKTRHYAWLQGFVKCLNTLVPAPEWNLCVPQEQEFFQEEVRNAVLASKDKFLKVLTYLPHKEIVRLASSAHQRESWKQGYLDIAEPVSHVIYQRLHDQDDHACTSQKIEHSYSRLPTEKTCYTLTQLFFQDFFFLAIIYKDIDEMKFSNQEEFLNQWKTICARLFSIPAARVESLDRVLNRMIEKLDLVAKKNIKRDDFIFHTIIPLQDFETIVHEKYMDYLIGQAARIFPDCIRVPALHVLAEKLVMGSGLRGKKQPLKALEVLHLIFNKENDKHRTWNQIIAEWDKAGDPYQEMSIPEFSHCIRRQFPDMQNNLETRQACRMAHARVMARDILKIQAIAMGKSPLLEKDLVTYADAAINMAAEFPNEIVRLTSLCSLARQMKDYDPQMNLFNPPRALYALSKIFNNEVFHTNNKWDQEENPLKYITLEEFDEIFNKLSNEMTPEQQKDYLLAQAKVLYWSIKK